MFGTSFLPVRKSDNPRELVINKVVNILKNRIRSREKLNEVTDGLANTCRDDAENHECNQKSKRAYELERVDIGHVNARTY